MAYTLLNFGVTGPKFAKFFSWCSQIITIESFKAGSAIFQYFGMPRLWVNVNRPILLILTLKLVAMAMSLEGSEKVGQISNLQSNTYHMAKIWWKSVQ